MDWRENQATSRNRYLAKFDEDEAERYDTWVGNMSREEEDAYLADLRRVFSFREGMAVLDAGAGTGALCKILSRLGGLSLTALEPAPAMLAKLTQRPELRHVAAVPGFCDSPDDRRLFAEGQFDVVASRQLANGLYDPLSAFRNWFHWLKPGGSALVIEGLFGRDAWQGRWEEEIDLLPLSACQSTALLPYLLESVGFIIDAVARMDHANARPTTRSTRYVVVARKPI